VTGQRISTAGAVVQILNRDVSLSIQVQRSGSGPPETQQATVRIQVVDQTRKGVAGATVTVMEGSRRLVTGTTDGSGYYQARLSPGAYSIKASGTGINSGETTVKARTQDTSAMVRVARSQTPSVTPGGTSLKYIAQYLPPGRKAWITIGTYSSRGEADKAIKSAKIPLKSQTRVVPSQRGATIRQPIRRSP